MDRLTGNVYAGNLTPPLVELQGFKIHALTGFVYTGFVYTGFVYTGFAYKDLTVIESVVYTTREYVLCPDIETVRFPLVSPL